MICPTCGSSNPDEAVTCSSCRQALRTPAGSSSNTSSGQTDRAVPSLFKILKTDYVVMLCTLAPLVFLAMYIATGWFGLSFSRHDSSIGRDESVYFLVITMVSTAVCIPILLRRVKSITSLFSQGEVVIGRVTSIRFFKDRGRIEYEYVFRGDTYISGNAIMKNNRTRAIQEGGEVTLVVDPANPKRAMIRDLYL